ncbi:MAG: hypothetical protein NZM02_01990 [Patescibacteria group bacterium]|nr:hypothetical protein [Patescibacteria group bacterium]
MKILKNLANNLKNISFCGIPLVSCPLCNFNLSAIPGTRDAICQNCGYKEPCCG